MGLPWRNVATCSPCQASKPKGGGKSKGKGRPCDLCHFNDPQIPPFLLPKNGSSRTNLLIRTGKWGGLRAQSQLADLGLGGLACSSEGKFQKGGGKLGFPATAGARSCDLSDFEASLATLETSISASGAMVTTWRLRPSFFFALLASLRCG